MEIKGLVSCVIPTFKRSDTLSRAIDSVLSQTYKGIEVLVVDDNEKGSEESKVVERTVQSYIDDRVKLVIQPKHINGAEARNAGVRASSGEYIAFLDDDDEWLPTKIEKQITILETHPEIGGVTCLYNEYNCGKVFHSCPPYTGDGLHRKVFDRTVAVFTSTILLRKETLMNAGLFDNKLIRHQDLQLLMDFTRCNKMIVINEYLVKLHSDSAINRPNLERLIHIKEDFFNAVSSHFEIYSKKAQSDIKAAHYFEIIIAALREKKLMTAIKYLCKVGLNIKAYKSFFKRAKNRKFIANS